MVTTSTDASDMAVSEEEYMEEAAADTAEEASALNDQGSQASMSVIQQQLQETLNLIVLKNKMELSPDLNQELIKTIQSKVADYDVAQNVDIIEIKSLEVIEENENEETIQLAFKAKDKTNKIFIGEATAELETNQVEIDGEIYQDYQVFFEKISLRE